MYQYLSRSLYMDTTYKCLPLLNPWFVVELNAKPALPLHFIRRPLGRWPSPKCEWRSSVPASSGPSRPLRSRPFVAAVAYSRSAPFPPLTMVLRNICDKMYKVQPKWPNSKFYALNNPVKKYPCPAFFVHCAYNALGKERLPEKLASVALSVIILRARRQTDDACDGLTSAPGRYAARPAGRSRPSCRVAVDSVSYRYGARGRWR